MDKKHLSFTQLNMLSRCGEQYRRRYIKHEKVPPGVSLIRGITVHKSIEKDLTSKMRTGNLLSQEEVKDLTADVFKQEWNNIPVKLTEEEQKEGLGNVKGRMMDESIDFGVHHNIELAPTIEPVEVERKWLINCEGYPYNLTGKIDIQEEEMLIDTKTSGKTPPSYVADRSDQLTAYAFAMYLIDKKIYDVRLDYMINLKSGIKNKTFNSARDMTHFETFKRRFENACTALEKGVFVPAQPTDWSCSEKFCGYWSTCPYIARGVVYNNQ